MVSLSPSAWKAVVFFPASTPANSTSLNPPSPFPSKARFAFSTSSSVIVYPPVAIFSILPLRLIRFADSKISLGITIFEGIVSKSIEMTLMLLPNQSSLSSISLSVNLYASEAVFLASDHSDILANASPKSMKSLSIFLNFESSESRYESSSLCWW